MLSLSWKLLLTARHGEIVTEVQAAAMATARTNAVLLVVYSCVFR